MSGAILHHSFHSFPRDAGTGRRRRIGAGGRRTGDGGARSPGEGARREAGARLAAREDGEGRGSVRAAGSPRGQGGGGWLLREVWVCWSLGLGLGRLGQLGLGLVGRLVGLAGHPPKPFFFLLLIFRRGFGAY